MEIYPKIKIKTKQIINLRAPHPQKVLLHFSDEFGPFFLPNLTTTITPKKTRFPIKIVAFEPLNPQIS
jgi:hypothetical protein